MILDPIMGNCMEKDILCATLSTKRNDLRINSPKVSIDDSC